MVNVIIFKLSVVMLVVTYSLLIHVMIKGGRLQEGVQKKIGERLFIFLLIEILLILITQI